jgi:transcriptional regulator with XRE-family HTH domain
VFGDNRRVPGLRREEAAMLAGVSVDYYTKMERGNLRGVSQGVLDALARGLRLNEAEHMHLLDLARAVGPTPPTRRRPAQHGVRPGVQRFVAAITDAPVLVQNGRGYVLTGQPSRLRAVLRDEPHARPAGQPRPVRLPRPPSPAGLSRMGSRRRRHRRDAAHRGRPRPPRPQRLRPRRRSSPPKATRSGSAGRLTTSVSTRPAPNDFTTRSSESSPSPTK